MYRDLTKPRVFFMVPGIFHNVAVLEDLENIPPASLTLGSSGSQARPSMFSSHQRRKNSTFFRKGQMRKPTKFKVLPSA